MGVSSASFTDTYREKVTDLMINLVEYIQCMDNLKNPATGTGTGDGNALTSVNNNSGPTQGQLKKNRNGFPILPDPLPDDNFKKTEWEALFTEYLGQQYHLATGGKIMQIPYKRISENQRDFIDSKYLPRKTIFRAPRNIALQEMKGIFEYLLERQRVHGPEDTFKFKSIKLKGKTVPSHYKPSDNNESDQNESDPDPDPGARAAPDAGTPPNAANSTLNTPPLSQLPSNTNTNPNVNQPIQSNSGRPGTVSGSGPADRPRPTALDAGTPPNARTANAMTNSQLNTPPPSQLPSNTNTNPNVNQPIQSNSGRPGTVSSSGSSPADRPRPRPRPLKRKK